MAGRRRKRKGKRVQRRRPPSAPAPPPAAPPAEPLWRHLPTVLAAAFAVRAAVALGGEFILHSDEVMQYLEPAHWLVFGNGVLHWEFFYGARSWLVPSVVAAILFACQAVGLDSAFAYQAAVELGFCAVSLCVPLGMYLTGRALFGEPAARLALLLGAFWYELVGFAHKPLSEFVATAPLLLLFALAVDRGPSTRRRTAAAGLLAVACAATRFQYAPAAGILLLAMGARLPGRGRLVLAGAAAAGVLGVGALDHLTWGGFLSSYFLNFDVNAVIASSRAGQSTPWSYLAWFGIASGGVAAVAGAALLEPRRRGLALLVLLSLLLPHLLLNHREYRFLFALVPLWLLLFSDVLATGFRHRSDRDAAGGAASGLRQPAGLAWAAIVSVLGILNLIPMQERVYRSAHAPENRFVHFLRDRDPALEAYARLAGSSDVQGFLDAVHVYHETRGYYGLHLTVPFYDPLNWRDHFAPEAAAEHVSHVLALPHDGAARAVPLRSGGLGLRAGGEVLPLPRLMGDLGSGRLEYWDEAGERTILGGFRHAETFPRPGTASGISGALSLWRRVDDGKPVRGWETWSVYPDALGTYPILEMTGRDDLRQPPPKAGIRLLP